ncbi:electron transport complex subunit E [candidate division KSB1 bacterium]|nr:electron transport complex subunit E [candidate division KSB1 bacterium]
MELSKEFFKGLYKENPVFRLALGLCPALAVSNSVENGIGMGVAVTFVLVCSNFLISLIRKGVPPKIRIPVFIVIIATFVTIADLVMNAYRPELHKNLGIFVPLIVVNCIILGRAEAFASKQGVAASFVDGLGMGIGFTLALVLIATVREILGAGTFLGYPLLGPGYKPVLLLVLAPGAFITMGLFMGLFAWLDRRRKFRYLEIERAKYK